MTEQTNQNPAAAAAQTGPIINPQAVYIKDCSFEAPNGPFVAAPQGNPTVNLNISTRTAALSQEVHEVVLQVNLEAKAGDKVVWLLELQQAGAFFIRGVAGNDLNHVLTIVAPNYLMGFARSAVSELVVQGGFPPFLLPLVTFEALHARAAQQQPAPAAPGSTVN